MFAGIILAAGASSRLGTPKALLDVRGEPAVVRASRQLAAAGCEVVNVVVGAEVDSVRRLLPRSATAVVHKDWRRGRTSSIKAGLRELPANCCTVLWPIDHPAIQTVTLSMLLDGPGDIRIPTFGGKRGHPTLFESNLREEILALADDEPLHDVVHRDEARVMEVPVDDPGVLLNVDTPDDLKKLQDYLRRSPDARPPA